MTLESTRIVLIESAHPGNIGAAARAMKTMSLGQLVLVRPHRFPSAEADRRAMGAVEILQEAEVVEDLAEAVRDCQLVIGCSARPRSFRHAELDARQCGRLVVDESTEGKSVALVFGPERMGLANRDLDRCSHQVLIPANEAFSSLNLASAVQLICYEIFMASRGPVVHPAEHPVEDPSDWPSGHEEMEYFYGHLERALDSRGYLDGEMREVTMTKLRRIFGRARPTPGELKILHSLTRLIHEDGG